MLPRERLQLGSAAVVLLVAAVLAPVRIATAGDCDALCGRVRSELRVFTDWLRAGNVRGYIGEVGWPDGPGNDGARWNSVAEHWFADADAAGLDVTAWATGEWWGTTYPLAVYEDKQSPSGVESRNTQSLVVEAHRSNASYMRGVNDAGAEFGAPTNQATSSFSNANPGSYDRSYHYDVEATFRYLASRGVKLVRIPFRWERIQPTLGGPLDSAEVGRLRTTVARARSAGLVTVLDMHNYGAYYLFDGTRGVRRALGSSQVQRHHFVDVWRRLSVEFGTDPGVHAYGLMNEPVGIGAAAGLTPARRWEIFSQAALDGIRGLDDAKMVMVAGYNWSGAQQWTSQHPRPWIVDPASNVRYEAHHYWDRDNSGTYAHTYDAEAADASDRNDQPT